MRSSSRGIIPTCEGGPVRWEPTTGRMFSTSKFAGLMKSHLALLTNPDAAATTCTSREERAREDSNL